MFEVSVVSFGVAPGIFMMVMIVLGVDYSALIDLKLTNSVADTQKYFVFNQIMAWFASLSYDVNNSFNASIKFLPFTALIIPFFSMFRLAKFNIDTRQSESFIGLPTPANTIFFTSFPLLISYYYNAGVESNVLNQVLTPWVLIAITLIMSLLLIAELPLFSLKFKHFKWKGNEIKFIFLGCCLILIPILFAWAIPIIIILYLILSVIENKRKKHAA